MDKTKRKGTKYDKNGKRILCNAVQMEIRIQVVYEMLVDAYSRYQIVSFCKKKWDVEAREADNYIARAKEQITAFAKDEDKQKFIDKYKTRFEKLYRMALARKDYRAAAKIADSANKVLGYEKLNLDHSGEIKSTITDEEYRNKLSEHLKEHQIEK